MAQWQGKAVEALHKVSPCDRDYEDCSVWGNLNPHIQSVRSYPLSTAHWLEQRAYLLTGIGLYHTAQGQYKAAEEELRGALASIEHTLGPSHPSTLDTILALGYLYWDRNHLTEAEVIYKRALAGFTVTFGPHHKDTLMAFLNLGIIYTSQYKWTEAHSLYQRMLQQHEKELPNGFETYEIYQNLGHLSEQQGKQAEADDFYGRALDGYEKLSDLDYSSTFRLSQNMAHLYERQGRLVEAEDSYRRALTDGKLLDPDRPDISKALYNLGRVYAIQGKFSQAEDSFQQAIMGYEKLRGPDHFYTLQATIGFGNTQYDQGKFAEAEISFQRAVTQTEKTLGLSHSLTREPLYRLRSLYKELGRNADAEVVNRKLWSDPCPTICCDSCDEPIRTLSSCYHCRTCSDDDFDLCGACFDNGKICFHKGHRMVKRYIKDGRYTDDEDCENLPGDVASTTTQLLSALDLDAIPSADAVATTSPPQMGTSVLSRDPIPSEAPA
ncbi:hypothetical protein MMC30_003257 [Trapelia coarctata]|nr:hypothetical protein [Trapelia coarctata]